MILPGCGKAAVRSMKWRCKTDVGGVMSRHLYCSFYLLINGKKRILPVY